MAQFLYLARVGVILRWVNDHSVTSKITKLDFPVLLLEGNFFQHTLLVKGRNRHQRLSVKYDGTLAGRLAEERVLRPCCVFRVLLCIDGARATRCSQSEARCYLLNQSKSTVIRTKPLFAALATGFSFSPACKSLHSFRVDNVFSRASTRYMISHAGFSMRFHWLLITLPLDKVIGLKQL